MRAWLVVLGVGVGGCYQPSAPAGVPCGDNDACPAGQQCVGGICGGTEPGADASLDATEIDAAPLCTTWQPRHFDPCGLPMPLGDLDLTTALSGFSWDTSKPVLKGKMNTVIDVATMVMTQQDGPEVLVASVENFTLEAGATLDLTGDRALLIAVWGTATIDGTIDADASLTVPGPGGAGAYAPALGCGTDPTGNFGAAGSPATGAGGGALQGDGGTGGNSGGAKGLGGAAPTIIHGGCAGGGGGAGSGAQGTRGAGGGALEISARQSITVGADASIHAAGGGGSPGRLALGGGGGGGAGGYIGLDAPAVTIAGTITANGGGGGGGASDVADGSAGGNGRADDQPALGGAGATTSNIGTCGRGGDGSAGGTLAGGTGASSSCGGAGGGGGAGYILIWSPVLDVSGTVSPPVTGGP